MAKDNWKIGLILDKGGVSKFSLFSDSYKGQAGAAEVAKGIGGLVDKLDVKVKEIVSQDKQG